LDNFFPTLGQNNFLSPVFPMALLLRQSAISSEACLANISAFIFLGFSIRGLAGTSRGELSISVQ
jgi:hypothetical protein